MAWANIVGSAGESGARIAGVLGHYANYNVGIFNTASTAQVYVGQMEGRFQFSGTGKDLFVDKAADALQCPDKLLNLHGAYCEQAYEEGLLLGMSTD